MSKLIAINIQWDVDNEEDLDCLPQRVVLPEGMVDDDEISETPNSCAIGYTGKHIFIKEGSNYEQQQY